MPEHYSAIIDGKRYSTETADEICDVSPRGYSCSDFEWHDTRLYRTKNGRFFLAGRGGASSMWATAVGQNGRTGGSGIQPIEIEKAKRLVERHADQRTWFKCFGEPEDA
jgi:hypothetical protein